MVRKIDFQEAGRLLEEEKNAVLLDVREEDEYITGHAVDALLLPVSIAAADGAAAGRPRCSRALVIPGFMTSAA